MHPKIKNIIDQLNQNVSSKELNRPTLEFLKLIKVTQTEAIISIHLGWQLPLQYVQDYIYDSNIWEQEDINEIAYQTFMYM